MTRRSERRRRERQARLRDALAWLVIAVELAAISVLAHAAMLDKPAAPVEVSPAFQLPPPAEDENSAQRESAAVDEPPAPAPMAEYEREPVTMAAPVIPSLGDDDIDPEKESPLDSAANPAERLDAEEEEQGSGTDGADERRSEADFATTRTSPGDIELVARTIWGEAENVKSTMEQAAVAWCVLNRVDSARFPDSIAEVVTAPGQFHGYRSADRWGDCPEVYIDLATDVVTRWEREKDGETDTGRVLPAEYLYFEGDMVAHNYFRTEWLGGLRWWWTAENPYED